MVDVLNQSRFSANSNNLTNHNISLSASKLSPYKPGESRAHQLANSTAKKSSKNFFDNTHDDLNDRIDFDRSIKVGQSSQNRYSQQKVSRDMQTPKKQQQR